VAGPEVEAAGDQEKCLLAGERYQRRELGAHVLEHLAHLDALLFGVPPRGRLPVDCLLARVPSHHRVDGDQGLPF
jgi:hypothetical protein